MKKRYIQSLVFLIVLLISNFLYAQTKAKDTPKTFKQEMSDVEGAYYQGEAIKQIGTALTRAAMNETNRAAVSKTTQEILKYSKNMSKAQMQKFLARLSKMSNSGITALSKMSSAQLNNFVADAAGKLSKNAGVLRQIIGGAGEKAGNAALLAISKVDDIIANNGTVPKALFAKMKDAASKLPPEKAKAYLDLIKKKFSEDWTKIVDIEDVTGGPRMIGAVVDGVFVLNDAYDIYYSDDEPELKAIKATSKIIDYGVSSGAGIATAELGAAHLGLGAGLGVGLTIAFTANRVSTLYTEIVMLQKEREAVKDALKNERIDNGILVRRQLVNINNKIKSGQVRNAKSLLIKLDKFILNKNIDNLEKLYELHAELEEKANNAERNELINEIISEARHPFNKALNFYMKGVELNRAKIHAAEALVILNNNLKIYPEIGGLMAIPKTQQLISLIDEKIANASELLITGTNLPKHVDEGEFIEIKVFLKGGIPFYSATGDILGNTSDDEVVTMYWYAPSEPGIEHLTFNIRDCMGSVASVSASTEVVERTEEDIEEDIVLEEFEGNSRIDGLWEINLNSDVIKTRSYSENNKATYKVTKFSELYKDTESIWGGTLNIAKDVVLKFFNSKKIYLQKIETLEHGFSFFYMYKYDEDTFEQIVLREIDDSHFEIFPINSYEASNYRLILSVKGNYMECSIEEGSSSMSSYKYKLFRKNTPSNPPTLSNGAWSWNELEDDFKGEVKIYSRLSSAEKNNFNLSKIEEDEDAYGTLQWKIALFKKYQSQYTDLLSSYKGKIPSMIQKEDIVWELTDVQFIDLGTGPPYSITSSLPEGWVKIWKTTVESEHGENYIAPINSEDDPNDKRTKTKVAEFSWDLPKKQYSVMQKWNTNFQRSGSLKAILQTLEYGNVIADNLIEFNSDSDSKEVTLECKYYYTTQSDYEMYNDFRVVFKFESHIK